MDRDYWNEVYDRALTDDQGRPLRDVPSPFAQFCVEEAITDSSSVLELGCGNGRDAFFFASRARRVHALDQSQTAIDHNTRRAATDGLTQQLTFQCADISSHVVLPIRPTVVYARFVLHSITRAQQNALLDWLRDAVDPGTMLVFEARTVADPLCGKGEPAGDNAYVSGHYRRFLVPDEFIAELDARAFKLRYQLEGAGLAKYEAEDPIVLRAFFEKE